MAESGLSVTRTDLQSAVGYYLAFGDDPTQFNVDQLAQVNMCIDKGCRMFYVPVPLPGRDTMHEWSFMTPIGDLSLVPNQIDYTLPDDFGGLQDNAYLSPDDQAWASIKVVAVSRILSLRQRDLGTFSGVPEMIASNSLPADGAIPTRYQLLAWPRPNLPYTLKFEYRANPFKLTATATYPPGGMPHAEALRAACLAAAEIEHNDVRGNRYEEFMERLSASVHYDEQMNGPSSYGYNADRPRSRLPMRRSLNYVSYNGVIPGSSS